ncbi:aquaporin-4 isoform 3-T3 [Synchiropus picturatus]
MTWRELRTRQFWRATLAEMIGTLVLVSAVLGASVPAPGGHPVGPMYPAVAVGAAIVALGQCFGEISGAQVNPAVTLALLATRRLEVLQALVYISAQCLGASLGAGALYLALPVKTNAEHFVNKVPLELNAAQALAAEILCTFQMVFTVFSVEEQNRRENPVPGNLAIGFAHTAGVLIGVLRGQHESSTFSGSCHYRWLLGKPLGVLDRTGRGRDASRSLPRVLLRSKRLPSEAGGVPDLSGY